MGRCLVSLKHPPSGDLTIDRIQHQKLAGLRATLEELFARLESLGAEIDERIESKEYLNLIRKAFREWDQADTDEKRTLIVHLVTNAAGTRICSDDILRLFLIGSSRTMKRTLR
jgi:hypothetical protein